MDPEILRQLLEDIKQHIESNIEIEGISKRELIQEKKNLYELIARKVMLHNLGEADRLVLYSSLNQAYRDKQWSPEFLSHVEQILSTKQKVDLNIKNQFAEKFLKNKALVSELEYITNPLGKTASESGGIIKYQGKKFYVKPCTYDGTKINAKEIFIYKFLEYLGYGPKAHFLPTQVSSSVSGHYKGYIVTEDLVHDDRFRFVMDVIHNETNADNIKDIWNRAFADDNFLARFILLSLIDDISIINDSLGSNPENYGVLADTSLQSFYVRIVDFLPDSARPITFTTSLLQALKTKLETSRRLPGRDAHHVLSLDFLNQRQITKDLEERINIELSRLPILKSLNSAFDYVKDFLANTVYADSFRQKNTMDPSSYSAMEILSDYRQRILMKYEEAKKSKILIAKEVQLLLNDPDQKVLKLEDTLYLGKSKEHAETEIGPREIEGYVLQDVKDDGNCFYYAVYDQIRRLNLEPLFLRGCPRGTEPHTWLRALVEGNNFSDRRWSSGEDILTLSRILNVRIAVVDTRIPTGYHIYDDTIDNGSAIYILRLVFTGNHFLSISEGPQVSMPARSALRRTTDLDDDDEVAGIEKVVGVSMKLSDLRVNSEILGIPVVSNVPEEVQGFRYLLIDSDSLAVENREDIDIICLNIQSNTASCGDNALFTARKAQELGFKSYIYVENGHAVTLIRYDAMLYHTEILQAMSSIDLTENSGLWEKYLEVMTGNTLHQGNKTEIILQDVAGTLNTNNIDMLYNTFMSYITDWADYITTDTQELIQLLLWAVEVGQPSGELYPRFSYPTGRPDDEPSYYGNAGGQFYNPDNNMMMYTNSTNKTFEDGIVFTDQ